MRLRRDNIWIWYLAAGAMATPVYLAVGDATAKLVVWPLVGWSSVGAFITGVRLHRPNGARAWYLLAAGVATFIVGDNLMSIRNVVLHAETLFPSYVDVVYLAMYPLLIAGLAILVRRRTHGRDRASVIDAAIVTGGLGLLSWTLLIVPYVRDADLGLVERLVSIAYPIGDIALLAIAVRLAVAGGRRPPAFWLLAASIVPLIVADSLYGFMNLAGTWHEHNPVDIGWILFYVGWGAAALHPSMGALSRRAPSPPIVTRRRLLTVGSAALIPPAVLFVEQARGHVVDAGAIAVTAAALFALVLARVGGLAREVAESRSEAKFRSLVQHSFDAIVVLDDAGRVQYQTPSAGRVLGHDPSDLQDHDLTTLLEPSDGEHLRRLLATPGIATSASWTLRHDSGQARHLDAVATDLRHEAGVGGVVLTLRDSTERTELEAELRRRAFEDDLTGLANRAVFADRASHALRRAARQGETIAVLFLDLDDFKMVNDSLGHGSGDELLVAVGRRLEQSIRPGDTVARLGGDEFAFLLEDGEMPMAAEEVARRVLDALRAPFIVGGTEVPVQASVGIALAGPDHTVGELLRDADLAMYIAKRNGKGSFERYRPEMHEAAVRRLEVAAELQRAIDGDELEVFYQPIVEIHTGRTLGVEALVRWNHRRRGLLGPDDFIPVAEATGLIGSLGRWVLHAATRQVEEWRSAGRVDDGFSVSVNVSARQLQDPALLDDVEQALRTSGLPPTSLVLEITESTLVANLDSARTALAALRALGLRIAIDDFGTGYSSLSYLSSFPVDVLKIDKSFVDHLTDGHDGAAMVRAVLDMSATLGLTTVAEGIEDEDQRNLLDVLGCPSGQGYLFARPRRAGDMDSVLVRASATAGQRAG